MLTSRALSLNCTFILLFSVLHLNAASVALETPPVPELFVKDIQPFLDNYCYDCHSSDLRKGDVDLEELVDVAEGDLHQRRVWEIVFKQLRAGAMPPDDEFQPTADERAKLVDILEHRLSYVDPTRAQDPGRVTARRFNRTEYDHTIRDLFGIRLTLGNSFPSDDVGYGFDNIGDVHSTSPLRLQRYLEAAETITNFLFQTGQSTEINRNEQAVFFDRYDIVKSSDAGVVLDHRSRATVDYDVPLPGSYTLHINAWGLMPDSIFKARSIDELTGWPEFPNAFRPNEDDEPEVLLEVWVDGSRVDSIPIHQGENSRDWHPYPSTFSTSMGVHEIAFRLGVPDHLTGEAREAWLADPPRVGVREARLEGPFTVDRAALSPLHQLLLNSRPTTGFPPAAAANAVFETFLPRAFRRPVPAQERRAFVNFVLDLLEQGESFPSALAGGVQAALISPHFLYRLDAVPEEREPDRVRPVGDYALASRLSYFLWASMPDDTLFTLAAAGRLDQEAELARQVTRMLNSPRATAFKEGFFRQWLDLRKLRLLTIDRGKFPVFTEDLRADVETETLLFIRAIIDDNRPLQDLLTADFTFVNDPLARLYGMPREESAKDLTFRRVSLTDLPRRGLLTQPSILMLTSYPNRTSPTKRGNWILEAILGDEPPPPPPNVPQLETAAANHADLPLREQLELHRTNQTCASCHATMDPIGLGLENFDAVGRWRSDDAGAPIDASGVLPGGVAFDGPLELLAILNERSDDFATCFTRKLLTYALGRGLEFYDRIAVDDILQATAAHDHRIQDVVTAVVQSRPFRLTRDEAPAESPRQTVSLP